MEPLVDPPSPAGLPPLPLPPPAAGTLSGDSESGSKVFLLEPTTISAQAFVVSRLPPRSPPLAPGAIGGAAGGGGRPAAAVRAISLHGEAWRTLRPSLLQNLPSLVRTWAQVGGYAGRCMELFFFCRCLERCGRCDRRVGQVVVRNRLWCTSACFCFGGKSLLT